RIAMLRVGVAFTEDSTPAAKFQLGDHLISSNIVIDDAGHFINREEFTPYGETSFGSFGHKRYRFTGKERDEENGLQYHGARYYAPWLANWTSADPAGSAEGVNAYRYARNNPMLFVDPDGASSLVIAQQRDPKAYKTTEERTHAVKDDPAFKTFAAQLA